MESVEKLESENKSLKLDIKELKRARNELNEENEKLRMELANREKSESRSNNENVISELEFELKTAKEEIGNLKQHQQEFEEEKTKLDIEHEKLVHQYVHLEIELKNLKAEKEKLSDGASERVNSNRHVLARSLTREEIEKRRDELTDIFANPCHQKENSKENIELKREISELQREIQRFEIQSESYRIEELDLINLQGQIQSLTKRNQDMRKESELDLSQYKQKLAVRDEEIRKLYQQIKDKDNRIESRESFRFQEIKQNSWECVFCGNNYSSERERDNHNCTNRPIPFEKVQPIYKPPVHTISHPMEGQFYANQEQTQNYGYGFQNSPNIPPQSTYNIQQLKPIMHSGNPHRTSILDRIGDGITYAYPGEEKETGKENSEERRREIQRFEVQRESYKTKIKRGESELRDLQGQIQSLRKQNEDLREQSELDLSQQRDWLEARDEEITELRKQIRDKQENNKGREELLENKIKVLTKELEQQKDINDCLNYELKENKNEFEVKMMVATKNRDDMRDKYTKSEKEKHGLQEQIERFHALIDTVKQNTDTLKFKLDDEKNRIERWSCSYCGAKYTSEQEKDEHMLNYCTSSPTLMKQVRPPVPKIPQIMNAHTVSHPEGQIYANYEQPQSYGYIIPPRCTFCGTQFPSEQERDLHNCTNSPTPIAETPPVSSTISPLRKATTFSHPEEGQYYANQEQPPGYGYGYQNSPNFVPQPPYNIQQPSPVRHSYVQRPSIPTPTPTHLSQPPQSWGQPSSLRGYPPPPLQQDTGPGGYGGGNIGRALPETPPEGSRLPTYIQPLRHISQPMSFAERTEANSWEGEVQPGNRQRSKNTSQ